MKIGKRSSRLQYIQGKADFTTLPPLKLANYLENNWIPSIDMWCAYRTNEHIDLGNSTNNRFGVLQPKGQNGP